MGVGKALLVVLFVGATAVAAAWAPLWTYALSLSLFGLPHVLVELRYVDERFAARVPPRTLAWFACGLCGIVGVRLAALGGLGTGTGRATLELLLGTALVAGALPLLRHHRSQPLALAVGAALLLGALLAPLPTLVLLALLHNLTPVGFLAERLRSGPRLRALGAAALVFGVVPAILLGVDVPDRGLGGPFTSGELDAHLPAFVPGPLLDGPFADRLFAAAAYLQCMHYAVVLHVLPALGGAQETAGARVRWPDWTTFTIGTAIAGGGFLLGFRSDFAGTRGVYAVFAALHAWLEIPVLVLACGVAPRHPLPTAA
jgi:hypothetical protein